METKILSHIAAVTFSIYGLFAVSQEVSACEVAAINNHIALQDAGYSHADAYEISGILLEWCEWNASFE